MFAFLGHNVILVEVFLHVLLITNVNLSLAMSTSAYHSKLRPSRWTSVHMLVLFALSFFVYTLYFG